MSLERLDKGPWRYVGPRGKVPTFRRVKDCKLHAAELRGVPSHPKGAPFCQYLSVFGGWEDLESFVFPALDGARKRIQDLLLVHDPKALTRLFATPLYRHLSPLCAYDATLATWSYLYTKIRCGIFVKISGGTIKLFIPFYNPSYRNSWPKPLPFSLDGKTLCSYKTYLEAKNKVLKWPEAVEEDHGRWWANGAVLCNVTPPNGWGDAYLAHLRDMLEAMCATKRVGDVEFFINKRDNPVLRLDGQDPCVLGQKEGKGRSYLRSPAYAPVLSFYTSSAYGDLLLPAGEDWELATGAIFPPYAKADRSPTSIQESVSLPWSKRKDQAIFRGSATGSGVTCETNLRLALVAKAKAMAKAKAISSIDAGIVKWALRDKVDGGKVRFLHPPSLPFDLSPYVPFRDQCTYKVQIYVDGHAAANRLGSMLLSGSLILRLLPSPGSTISLPDGHDSWLSRYLNPYPWIRATKTSERETMKRSERETMKRSRPKQNERVSWNCIECTLETLKEAMDWVHANDELAEGLAKNAKHLARRLLSPSFISSYLAALLNGLHAKTKGGQRSTLFPRAGPSYAKPLFL